MSHLNKLKNKAKELPNDADLGSWVRQYIKNQKTCCDKVENRDVKYSDDLVATVYCKECGIIIL